MAEKKAPKRKTAPTTRRTGTGAAKMVLAPAAPPDEVEPSVSEEEIARRAYALWEERGCPIGSPEEDWHRAIEEFRARSENGSK